MTGAPRVELNEPRSVGAILTTAGALLRAYPLLFTILALAVMAPFELAVLAITGYGPLRSGHEDTTVTILVLVARSALIGPLISALHVHAVVVVGDGERPRLGAVAARGLQVLAVVAAADIMSALGIALGFLALIVPGVLLALRWAVVAQAAALEDGGWLDALRTSGRLTRGRYGHVFGLLLVTGAINLALRLVGEAIHVGSSSGAPSVALGIAIDTAVASFSALTLALLYFDLKARAVAPRRPPEHANVPDLD
jgi:hypothetical protein